jgi:hypothetical protein
MDCVDFCRQLPAIHAGHAHIAADDRRVFARYRVRVRPQLSTHASQRLEHTSRRSQFDAAISGRLSDRKPNEERRTLAGFGFET